MNPQPSNPSFDRDRLRAQLTTLAKQGIWIGGSSWKYAGWIGDLYDRDRYVYHGKFSTARFERLCLKEYCEYLPSVCVDAAYYQFPSEATVEDYLESSHDGFRFSFKVTDNITLKRFPNLPRFGTRAGETNPDFLNAELFVEKFLKPLQPLQPRVGSIIFEFTRFQRSDFERGRDFVTALETFLKQLPVGWHYAVELRNESFLHRDYLSMLEQVGGAHVVSSWEAMPPADSQAQMPGVISSVGFTTARLLLKPGRKYAEAVALFSPYQEIKEPCISARAAALELINRVRAGAGPRIAYIYVNNRLEGNSLRTIGSIADQVAPPQVVG